MILATGVKWAKQHDWFVSAERYYKNKWEVVVRDPGTGDTKTFRSFIELKNWAGY